MAGSKKVLGFYSEEAGDYEVFYIEIEHYFTCEKNIVPIEPAKCKVFNKLRYLFYVISDTDFFEGLNKIKVYGVDLVQDVLLFETTHQNIILECTQ